MSWQPLHSGDPFPADPDAMADYGTEVSRTGALIGEQIALLRLVAQEDRWTTETADAFRERASETADKIAETQDRYVRVGAAITTLAGQCEEHERAARLLVADAQQAQAAIAANPEQTPSPGEDGAPGELTDAQRAQNARRNAAVDELAQLQRRFDAVVAAAEEDGHACQREIDEAKDDGVKDSWWERNAGWLKALATALGVIAAVAGIALLIVGTGGLILFVAIAAGAAAFLINLTLAITADSSWTDVALDGIGLLTLGLGGPLLKLARYGFQGVRTATASARASRVYHVMTEGSWLFRFGSRVAEFRLPLIGTRVPVVTRLAEAFRDNRIATATGEAIAAGRAVLEAPSTSVFARIVAGGPEQASLLIRVTDSLAVLRGVPDYTDLASELTRIRTLLGAGQVNSGIGVVSGGISTVRAVQSYGPLLVDLVRGDTVRPLPR
jgi:hypothetical protein